MTLRLSTHSAGGHHPAGPGPGPADRRPAPATGWLTTALGRDRRFAYVPVGPPRPAGPTSSWTARPRPGTVCTLSHWPGTPTPAELWHDVSAGIVAARPAAPGPAARRCRGGHRSTTTTRTASIALGLLVRRRAGRRARAAAGGGGPGGRLRRGRPTAGAARWRSPWRAGRRRATPARRSGVPAGRRAWRRHGAGRRPRLATILPALADDPERFEALWRDEADAYDASVRRLAEGWATIEEHPRARPGRRPRRRAHPGRRRRGWEGAPLHPAAVHCATRACGWPPSPAAAIELRYRYESWVRLPVAGPGPGST